MIEEVITPETVKAKILKLGFTEVDTEKSGTTHYSRQTIVGAPTDSDGDKVFVFVAARADGFFDFTLTSPSRRGWVNIEYTDIQPEYFFRNLKSIERQVVYAWRELAD